MSRYVTFLAAALTATFMARADAAAEDAYLCALYAREYVRIEVTTGARPDLIDPTPDQLVDRAVRVYDKCLNLERVPRLPGTKLSRSTATWAVHVTKLALSRQGIVPATEGWRDRCRDEYRTWDEDTETVIRRVSKGKRVPCPYQPKPENDR